MVVLRYGAVVAGALVLLFATVAAASPMDDLKKAVDTAGAVVSDPDGSVQDPHSITDPVLGEGEEGGDEPAPPEGDEGGGFADGLRAALQDELLVAGVAGVAAVAVGLAGFALVTRYVSPKEALKNPQRAMLYGFIRATPGAHLKQLSEEFRMKTSSILWHLRKLESAELVRSERANGFRVFYAVEGGIEIRRVSRALTALQNENARRVFERLDNAPGGTGSSLSQDLGIHAGTVRWHLRKLREFGLLEELVRDDGSRFYPTPLGRKALETLFGKPTTPARRSVGAPMLE